MEHRHRLWEEGDPTLTDRAGPDDLQLGRRRLYEATEGGFVTCVGRSVVASGSAPAGGNRRRVEELGCGDRTAD
jgi:hypothetical protein